MVTPTDRSNLVNAAPDAAIGRPPLALALQSSRHGVSFADCLRAATTDPAFIREYDRLRGSNLSLEGSGLELAIDESSGRQDAEIARFIDDVWDLVFLRF